MVSLARHAKGVDGRIRVIRLSTLAVVWLAGLAAGFVGALSAVARYGCGTNDDGFACRGSGSLVGVLIVAAAIVIVVAVTLMTHDRPARRVLTVGGVGVASLVICLVAARGLLSTA
jgi:hypothetical protein